MSQLLSKQKIYYFGLVSGSLAVRIHFQGIKQTKPEKLQDVQTNKKEGAVILRFI